MGIRNSLAATGVLFLLAACATAPPPPEPDAPASDARLEALSDAVAQALAAAPGSAPRGLSVTVPAVEESGSQYIYEALFDLPETWNRRAQDFTVYVACERDDLPTCTRKIVDAAQALDTIRADEASPRGSASPPRP